MTFTKTETLRRLRALAAEARDLCDLPRNSRAEVGSRCIPQVAATLAEAVDRKYPEGDDLFDFLPLTLAASDDDVQREGSLVHLYFYVPSGFGDWELEDVCVGWLGTPGTEPRLLDTNGRPLPL